MKTISDTIVRWQLTNLLDADRDQWSFTESVLQGSGDTRSPKLGGQGYIHFGATVGFDNQVEEAAEVPAWLQGLLSAVVPSNNDRFHITTHNS